MYIEKIKKAYNIWKARERAVVYHAPTSIPIPQVSFNTSNTHNATHSNIPKSIRLSARSNFEFWTSIMAKTSNRISSISLGRERGIGTYIPCHMIKKLTTIKIQKISMDCRKVETTKTMTSGNRQIAAKTGRPAVTSSYIASKNRRKSTDTLPPFSFAYVVTVSLFIIGRVRFL